MLCSNRPYMLEGNPFALLRCVQMRLIQLLLLVTGDGHNLIFASQVFSRWHLSQFVSSNFVISVLRSNFVISVLRSFDAFNAFYHFIHQQCCLLVTKVSHNPIFASQVFSRWHLSHSLPLANSWILIMKTPWFVMLLTTFPSTVLSIGQQRWSQASSSHRNFFVNIFFAIRFWRFPIPWVLLCEALKCVMLSTTFSSTMLSVGHQKWSHSLSSRLTFFLDIFVTVCF